MQTPETLECPKCGLPVRHVAAGLALCAGCGAATPVARPAEERRRASPYDGLGLDELRAERRALEREIERSRAAAERSEDLPRLAAVGGSLCVLLLVGAVVSVTIAAFKWYGSVNVRYVTVYGSLLFGIGIATVAAVVWSLRDPNAPLRMRHLVRLRAAERALRDVDARIARLEGGPWGE